MKTLITDASVGVKWIFPEEHDSFARKIFDQIGSSEVRIVVPELFYSEVANACWVRVKRKMVQFQEAVKLLGLISKLPLLKRADSEFTAVALEHAVHYNISAYDALYVALAETYLASLVTADKALLQSCRAKGFEFIESLEEVNLS